MLQYCKQCNGLARYIHFRNQVNELCQGAAALFPPSCPSHEIPSNFQIRTHVPWEPIVTFPARKLGSQSGAFAQIFQTRDITAQETRKPAGTIEIRRKIARNNNEKRRRTFFGWRPNISPFLIIRDLCLSLVKKHQYSWQNTGQILSFKKFFSSWIGKLHKFYTQYTHKALIRFTVSILSMRILFITLFHLPYFIWSVHFDKTINWFIYFQLILGI